MTDLPYPTAAIIDRVARIEQRVDNHDAVVTTLGISQAVTTEQVTTLRGDIRELIEQIAAAHGRVTAILRGVWALVLVMIPVALSLIMLTID